MKTNENQRKTIASRNEKQEKLIKSNEKQRKATK